MMIVVRSEFGERNKLQWMNQLAFFGGVSCNRIGNCTSSLGMMTSSVFIMIL